MLSIRYEVLFKKRNKLLDAIRLWRKGFFKLYVIGILSLFSYLINDQINLTGSSLYTITIIITSINWILFAVAILDFTRASAERLIQSPQISNNGIKATYIRAVSGIVGSVSAIVIFIYGLSKVGVSLIPLLSAVGIGGLAIALAVRPTFENIIGSIMIFTDKPYKVGERILVNGYDGVVESIGLRSTRIRNLTGHLTTIPNDVMARVEIENVGLRPYIRRLFHVTLPFSATPEQMENAVGIIRNILN